MAQRLIIKTDNPDGIPSRLEIWEAEEKFKVDVQAVPRLYVTFKVGKRRKIKRLRMTVNTHPCELCGQHTYISGKIGNKEFDKEIF